MSSLWTHAAQFPLRSALKQDLSVDAAVIGAGMAGILIAHALSSRGLRTVVLEAQTTGSGQTRNTTAKITAQHGLFYRSLTERVGSELARQYARANQEAVDAYRRLVQSRSILCDFADCPSYLYTQSRPDLLERELSACRALGLDVTLTQTTSLPVPVTAALRMDGQAMFHPLKFLRAIAQPLEVYEHTPVLSVRGQELVTPRGRVTATHIVFACHYPFVNFPGLYFTRMHQERSYVAAVEGAPRLDGMYYGIDPDGLSFRNAGSLLLVGGGSHRTGMAPRGGQYHELEARAKQLWPGCRPVLRWSAQDCMTLDGVPYIGSFSPTQPRWYVATGFQKWGMSTSMAAAHILSAMICGEDDPSSDVFSPRRFSLTAAKNLALESGQAAKHLTIALLGRPELDLSDLSPGYGGIVSHQGKKVGAYKDAKGQVYLVEPRCPHLGCQLAWNPEELSWDCPCHGSRFHYDGSLLNNPAQTGIKKRPR